MATSRAVIGFWLVHAVRLPGGLAPGDGGAARAARAGRLRAVTAAATRWPSARQAHTDIAVPAYHGKLVLDTTLSP